MFGDNKVSDYSIVTGTKALEKLLRAPESSEIVKAAFVEMIKSVLDEKRISFACFLAPEGNQPCGAFKIRGFVHSSLNLSTCVWSRESSSIIDGHRPHETERGIIIYDIYSSGKTLQTVARQIREAYGASSEAFVVYKNRFSQPHIAVGDGYHSIPVIDYLTWTGTSKAYAASSFTGARRRLLGCKSPDDGTRRSAMLKASLPLFAATICSLIVLGVQVSRLAATGLVAGQLLFSVAGIVCWSRIVKR